VTKIEIDMRDRIGRHDNVELADIGVEGAVEDALFGDLT
jgi:hypothetical protein